MQLYGVMDIIDDKILRALSRDGRISNLDLAGYFLIKDNQIQLWRDFSYPGAKQLIEPAPKA